MTLIASRQRLFSSLSLPLPSGALGYWVMGDYQAANQAVPNRMSKAPTAANIMRYSRRCFNGIQCLGQQINVTFVDNVAAAPDGSTQASSLAGTGAWSAAVSGVAVPVPIGTYTIACSVKRNTGADQTFELGDFVTDTYAVFTATSSWQRCTYTFTSLAAGIDPRIRSHLSANANLLICDFEAYAGAADLGPQTLAGHLYLGDTAVTRLPDTAHALSGGYIDWQAVSNSTGMVNFDGLAAPSNALTFMAVIKQTVTGANFSANNLISDPNNFNNLGFQYAPRLLFYLGGQQYSLDTGHDGFTSTLVGQGWKVLGCRSTGANVHGLMNSSTYADYPWTATFPIGGSPLPIAFRDFMIGNQIIFAGSFQGQIAAMALWPRALSAAEQHIAVTRMTRDVRPRGIVVAPSRLYIAEGDSITIGSDTTNGGYPDLYCQHAAPGVFGHNYAGGGEKLADFVARASRLDTAIPASPDGGKYFLTLLSINDLPTYADYGGSRTAYLAALAAYLDARRAAGFTVLLCTQTSVSGVGSTVNAERAILSPIFRSWVGLHCDAIVDFAADPVMGPDAASSDTTLYNFAVHPTDLGVSHLWPILKAVMDPL